MVAEGQEVDHIPVWLARIEGKIDLVNAECGHINEDMKTIRLRVHDFSNQLQILISLNLPEKLQDIHNRMTRHDDKLAKLELEQNQRKAVDGMIKLIWSAIGATTVGIVIGIFKILGGVV